MFSELNLVLLDFANEVVRLERRNLNISKSARKGRKINNTKALSNGLGFVISKSNSGFIVEFTSKENYAAFVDMGVNGTEVRHNAPFSFKSKFANIKAIEKYVRSNKIKLRKTFINKSGQKVSQLIPKNEKSIKAAAFVMARSIARNGMKPTRFFTDAINEAYDKLPPKAEEAIVRDLEDILFRNFQPSETVKLT